MTSLRLTAAATLSSLVVVHGVPASAQTASGGIISATVSAAKIEDGTSASIAGSIGYRFNPIVTLGVELMIVPSLVSDLPDIPTPLSVSGLDAAVFPFPVITAGSDGGHATIFTTHLRLTIPNRSRRMSPYVTAGAGVGSVVDNLRYTIIYPPIILAAGPAGQPVVYPAPLPPRNESITRTTTDFAATFGGGIGFITGEHWSLDVDARYIGIFGERDVRIGRYGGGITFRF
jgi:hypothetical protein